MSVRIETLRANDLPSAARLLQEACAHDEVFAIAEEKLFADGALARRAEPLAAFVGSTLVAVACTSDRWLRLLAVHPAHRKRGIGTALLIRCEKQMVRHGHEARVLDQPGNYLGPGVDTNNTESIAWLVKRRYEAGGSNTNLLIALADNPKLDAEELGGRVAACEERGYQIERLAPSEIDACAQVVESHYSRGWAFELRRAARARGVHVARLAASGDLVSFAAHDGNNQGLGWFGPTGTLANHQKQGLGAALLLLCLDDLAAAGHTHCQVAWIGPRDFYERVAGIASERHFTTMKKDLLQ